MVRKPPALRRVAATLFLLPAFLHAGCASRPSATLEGARVTALTVEHVDLLFDVKVTNPWVVPLPLAEAAGSLTSDRIRSGAPFLELTHEQATSVPAQGSTMIPLAGRLAVLPLITSLPDLAGDEVPYRASLRLRASVPATGQAVEFPEIQHDGKIPFLNLPRVSIAGVSWPTLAFDRVTGTVRLRFRNTNEFAVGPGTTDGKILLKRSGSMDADRELATFSARLEEPIRGGDEAEIGLSISFDPRSLFTQASWTSLAGALSSPSSFRVTGTLSGATPYVPVTLNFDTQ